MNRRFVEAVVGNATFVDRCRAALLEFLAQPHVHPHKGDKGDTGGKRRLGGRAKCHRADGSSCAAEAPYNNDLLVRWCAQRSGARTWNAVALGTSFCNASGAPSARTTYSHRCSRR